MRGATVLARTLGRQRVLLQAVWPLHRVLDGGDCEHAMLAACSQHARSSPNPLAPCTAVQVFARWMLRLSMRASIGRIQSTQKDLLRRLGEACQGVAFSPPLSQPEAAMVTELVRVA